MVVPDAVTADQSLGRFLRESMPAAEVIARATVGIDDVLVTQRIDAGCTLTRAVVRRDDRYLVIDAAEGGPATARWLLPADATIDSSTGAVSMPHATASLASGVQLVSRSSDDPLSGWWSPHYAELYEATVATVPISDGGATSASFAPAGLHLLTPHDVRHSLAKLPRLPDALISLITRSELPA